MEKTINKVEEILIIFQEHNCRGCLFAKPNAVGAGRPCCTFPGKQDIRCGICYSRREG